MIASHSSARALPDHRRNLSDDMLEALADRGGVASLPEGREDVSRLPLTAGLLARGHPPGVVRGVPGEKLLRVMAEVRDVAQQGREVGPRGGVP